METIGEQLRAARLAQNLTLEDLSENLKIRPRLLRYLERGEYSEFPAKNILVSFQRQYAQAVGVDEIQAVKAVEDATLSVESSFRRPDSSAPTRPASYFFERTASRLADQSRSKTGPTSKVVVALALIMAGSYWFYEDYRSHSGQDTAPVSEPAASAAGPEASESTGGGQSALPSSIPLPNHDRPAEGLAPASTAGTATPSRGATAAGALHIEIHASSPVWVRSLADDVREREFYLNPGESHRFRAREVVKMTLGSAGAATLLVNGKDQGKIGEMGQVRHLRITDQGWSVIPPGSF